MILSIRKAVKILDLIADSNGGLSIKEINGITKFNQSTIHHILATLMNEDMVKKEDRKYLIGKKVLKYASNYLNHLSIYKISYPIIKQLLNEFNENIYMTMLDGNEFIPIITKESSHSVKPTRISNDKLNAHATAIGKILLSSYSKEDLLAFFQRFDKFEKYTKNTLNKLDDILTELEKVKENKFALDLEESEYGINCIAVPIFNYNKDIIASIGISIPTQRFTDTTIAIILPSLKVAAEKISNELGYNY